ncbi:uncharacterized protein [Sinocyclocheilus grahami]|uniref:uncharacterized protein n=1 Tax=Sinocyclocheilus grahami TaxID=75366 RepID=UPI0007AC77A7|nr:PREDICTED: uncharacterized protein LOC107556772 [Sinocyclocheilus grahami]
MMFLYIYIVLLLEVPAAVLGVSLDQGPKVLFKGVGKTIYLPCKVTGLGTSDYIHWYQVKEGEAPSRLLYITQGGSVARDTNNPQATDFTVDKTKLYDLKLSNTQKSHSAVYFCAYWDTSSKVFGSGTRLYVTGSPVKSPKLYGYLPSKNDKRDKQTMLCQASGMFPDLVKFTWKKKSETGQLTDVPEENVVEQTNKNAVTVTSMMIIDKNTAENNDYQCTVVHEGITDKLQTLEMKREDSNPSTESKDGQNPPTCPPSSEGTIKKQISGDSEQIPSMFLFIYAYGVMLMKNGIYFCAVSIFLLKRKAGRKKDESS